MQGCKQAWMNPICQVYGIKGDVPCLQYFISSAKITMFTIYPASRASASNTICGVRPLHTPSKI